MLVIFSEKFMQNEIKKLIKQCENVSLSRPTTKAIARVFFSGLWSPKPGVKKVIFV